MRSHRRPQSCTKQRILDFLSGKRRLPPTASRATNVTVYCSKQLPAGWTPGADGGSPPAT